MSVMDTALRESLKTLRLSGMLETLDARLAQAHGGELGHLDFLQILCQDEITRRETVVFERRLRKAKFEQQVTLEGASTSTHPRSCPPPRSATWQPCAGSTPASP
ncbi:ATP-binding protein [Streptomyces sp. AC550_RSS872]|uniref:ATP-binding protein n=1 Tax=Streptomyces sp. AC550_RSS872 TaxID=2823689 RepID=UPI00266594B8|nr:ATP-binding protein [Streptomyces sp. AC550_RSS872]